MKISICDVCYHKDGKLVKSTRRGGFTGCLVDICDKHRSWLKQFNSRTEMLKGVYELETHTPINLENVEIKELN